MIEVFGVFLLPHLIEMFYFFFFKQKTAYEIVDCDWSSDVCSSDLPRGLHDDLHVVRRRHVLRVRAPMGRDADGSLRLEIGRASCRERV